MSQLDPYPWLAPSTTFVNPDGTLASAYAGSLPWRSSDVPTIYSVEGINGTAQIYQQNRDPTPRNNGLPGTYNYQSNSWYTVPASAVRWDNDRVLGVPIPFDKVPFLSDGKGGEVRLLDTEIRGWGTFDPLIPTGTVQILLTPRTVTALIGLHVITDATVQSTAAGTITFQTDNPAVAAALGAPQQAPEHVNQSFPLQGVVDAANQAGSGVTSLVFIAGVIAIGFFVWKASRK